MAEVPMWKIAEMFNIPTFWLQPPEIVFYVILPFIMTWLGFYSFLDEIGIFKRGSRVDYVLAAVFSFILIPFMPFNFVIGTLAFSFFRIKSTIMKILFCVGMFIIYFMVLPMVITFL